MLTKIAKNQRLQSYSNSGGLNGPLNDFNKSPVYLSHPVLHTAVKEVM